MMVVVWGTSAHTSDTCGISATKPQTYRTVLTALAKLVSALVSFTWPRESGIEFRVSDFLAEWKLHWYET